MEVDTNLPAGRVIRVLDRISEEQGCYPENLRMDNGPKCISNVMEEWAKLHSVELQFIQPGKPTLNSYIECFNRTHREEVFDFYIFNSLSEVRKSTEEFIREYNEERLHESMRNLTSLEFAIHAGQLPGMDEPQKSRKLA
ncbi:hypothetical protein SYK_32300 [Pseudodesulfovibrio nedwellii]|uniref:Integrase catalytic domain-containing protein n=1 Tax=Pseudodesulfovibrio nedwellii TaxID=2973072 RepID=A0ABN6SAL2_9BACT|nr:hypothetical protein SYK_32300 [Pseudodesulfovibrio nedwellii]